MTRLPSPIPAQTRGVIGTTPRSGLPGSRRRRPILAASTWVATGLLLAACGSAPTAATTGPSPNRTVPSPASTVAMSSAPTTDGPTTDGPTPAVTGPTPTVTSGGGTACTLVTESDITGTVGTDPGKGRAFSSRGSSQCQYGSLPTRLLIVNLNPTGGRAGYDNLRKNPKLGDGGMRIVNTTGVGDQGFELSGPHTDAVYFTKDDALVLVGISTAKSPPRGAALALAKIAAGRPTG